MPKPFRAMPGPRRWPVVGSVLQYSRLGRLNFLFSMRLFLSFLSVNVALF